MNSHTRQHAGVRIALFGVSVIDPIAALVFFAVVFFVDLRSGTEVRRRGPTRAPAG
jgi:hypothetical protein